MTSLLANGAVTLEFSPCGGVITRFDIGPTPVLYPARGNIRRDATQAACFPMLPWANRLSAGGVATEQGLLKREVNWPTTDLPVHGHGWQEVWRTVEQSATHVRLHTSRMEPAGFSYRAEQKVRLFGKGARIELSITNAGPKPLPFGLGLHPYFSRDAATFLTLPACRMIPMRPDGLPRAEVSVQGQSDFSKPRACGSGGMSVFYPDTRSATLTSGAFSIALICGGAFCHLMLWAPPSQPFLCIEPMSHPVDAFSQRVTAAPHDLAPGDELVGWAEIQTRFSVCGNEG